MICSDLVRFGFEENYEMAEIRVNMAITLQVDLESFDDWREYVVYNYGRNGREGISDVLEQRSLGTSRSFRKQSNYSSLKTTSHSPMRITSPFFKNKGGEYDDK